MSKRKIVIFKFEMVSLTQHKGLQKNAKREIAKMQRGLSTLTKE